MANQTIPAIQVKDSNVGIGTTTPNIGNRAGSGTLTIKNSSTYAEIEISGSSSTQGGVISFYGDTTKYAEMTGEYTSANNGMMIWRTRVSNSITENMRLTGGNLGIGTTSPSSKLHISGSSAQLLIQGNNYSGIHQAYAWVTNTYFGARYNGADEVYGASGRGAFKIAAFHDGDASPQYMAFYGANAGTAGSTITWNTVGFAQDEDGNVGIGTTNPAHKLDIGSNTSETVRISATATSGSTANLLFGSNTITSQAARIQGIYGGSWDGALAFFTQDAGAADGNRMTEKVRILSTGNVGIGTTAPATQLNILYPSNIGKDTVQGIIRLTGQANTENAGTVPSAGTAIEFYNKWNGGGSADEYSVARISGRASQSYAGGLQFDVAPTQNPGESNFLTAMSILRTGNVGIGTTAPTDTLGYGKALDIQSSSGAAIYLRDSNATSVYGIIAYDGNTTNRTSIGGMGASNYLRFLSEGNEAMRISSGNVGIGTTAPVASLQIGNGTSNTNNRSSVAILSADGGNAVLNALSLVNSRAAGDGNGTAINFHNANNYSPTGRIVSVQDSGTNASLRFSVYNSTDNTLVERITLLSSGNVGIGTTSPNTKLRIQESGSNPPLAIQNTNADGYSGAWIYNSAGTLVGHFGWANGTTTTLSDKMYFGTIAAKDVVFTTNDSEKVRITSAGNVGIGTTAPIYKFEVSDGTRTGVFNPNAALDGFFIGTYQAKPLILGTADNERMRITSDGNVGIGTTSPQSKLQVARAGNANGGTILMGLGGSGTNKWSFLAGTHYNQASGSGNGSGSAGVAIIGASVTETDNAVYIGGGPYEINPATVILFNTYTATTHNLGGLERMRITSAGNVGINTTNPTARLHVEAPSGDGIPVFRANGTTAPNSFNYAGSLMNADLGSSRNTILLIGKALSNRDSGYIGFNHSGTNGSNTNFLTFGLFQNDNILNITGAGNVGIGTTAPSNKLTVYQGGGVRVTGITSGDWIEMSGDLPGYSANQYPVIKSNGTIHFANNNKYSAFLEGANTYFGILDSTTTTRVFLATSGNTYFTGGNVGIGTTAPLQKLHVVGAVVGGNTGTTSLPNPSGVTTQLAFEARSTQTGNDPSIAYHKEAVYTMYLQGQNSPRGLRLYSPTGESTANFYVQGDVVAFSSSDRRLKDNLSPIPNALDKVSKLTGYEFDWNENQSAHSGHDYGVVAQEVEAVLPELVQTREDGYKAVKYDKIVAVLIEAIKEQQQQIDELKAKLK